MARPKLLDLAAEPETWREVPMPGANLSLTLVPLASESATFTIMGRFPAGFERTTPGGYFVAEEFVVLDGYLEIEGVRYVPGDLIFIPACYLRTRMRAPEGCRVLAWFGGPAIFRSVDELGASAVSEGIVSVPIGNSAGPDFFVTPEARWSAHSLGHDEDLVAGSDVINRELSQWCHIDGTGGATRISSAFVHRVPVESA